MTREVKNMVADDDKRNKVDGQERTDIVNLTAKHFLASRNLGRTVRRN
jgi:hypothetical protein